MGAVAVFLVSLAVTIPLGVPIAFVLVLCAIALMGYLHFTKEQIKHILKDSLPALFMPILIIGGIRFGIFTPTEAGAFAVVYALGISLFVYREMKLKDLPDVFMAGIKSTGLVMIICATASAVGWLITVAQIPAKVVMLLQPLIAHPLALLLVINLFLFIMGMIMDLTPNILIFGPILIPVIEAAGIDPIVFAVIMVLNLTIGLMAMAWTPTSPAATPAEMAPGGSTTPRPSRESWSIGSLRPAMAAASAWAVRTLPHSGCFPSSTMRPPMQT